MEDTRVTASEQCTFGTAAGDLRRIADLFDKVADVKIESSPWVHLDVQVDGPDEQIIAKTDAVGVALFGRPGAAKEISNGVWFYDVEGNVGAVHVHLYDRIADVTVRDLKRAAELAAKEAELERLRAELDELRKPTGLDYSRADDGQDPQPSAGRVDARYVDVVDEPERWHVKGCKGAVGLACTCPKPSEVA